jgi:hypothetical protein
LLTPLRLDLPIKWRFFRCLAGRYDEDAEAVYRAHILGRSGGVEKGSWKRNVDDYVWACWTLLPSMQANGFDAAHPVIVGPNGRIRNGAHRIACAIATGDMVAVRRSTEPGRSRPWDAEWMRRTGLPATDIARAEKDLESLSHVEDCGCHRS